MPRTESMDRALKRLCTRLGSGYGRVRFMWLCQKYNLMPWDECPEAMMREAI